MGTQSTVSQNHTVLKPQNEELTREEQVLNAVEFLSHPNVRGSSVAHKRYFLEKKGLTKKEIDEAFLILPPPAVSDQDTELKSTLSTRFKVPDLSRYYWSQALVALGLVAISGAGIFVFVKNVIVARLKSWIRKLVLEEENLKEKSKLEPSSSEEATEATDAGAEVAEASEEVLVSETEERRRIRLLMSLLKNQAKELDLMKTTLRNLQGQNQFPAQYNSVNARGSRPLNAIVYPALHSASVVASQPAAVAGEPSVPPQLNSYTQVRNSMLSGRQPFNIDTRELLQLSQSNDAENSGRQPVLPDLATVLSVPHTPTSPRVNLSVELVAESLVEDELRTIVKDIVESRPRDNRKPQSGDGDVDGTKTESSVDDPSARGSS